VASVKAGRIRFDRGEGAIVEVNENNGEGRSDGEGSEGTGPTQRTLPPRDPQAVTASDQEDGCGPWRRAPRARCLGQPAARRRRRKRERKALKGAEIATVVEVADDLTSQARHNLLLSGSPPSGNC
jgi:hypothetical protein